MILLLFLAEFWVLLRSCGFYMAVDFCKKNSAA